MKRITTSCLLSNYNYARFVGEAVEGALRQTVPFDEIIVVDDGSTDGSTELLELEFGGNPLVTIVRKENNGQLSCFNHGVPKCSGDIVFFLDADDVYEPQYHEQALRVYERNPACDFLYCGRRFFGCRTDELQLFSKDRDLGYSVLRTLFLHTWIGAATSCLSIRRQILDKILPLPFDEEWRVRADDCLVFGASLACARKRYLAQPLVRYRVHEGNHHCGKSADPVKTYLRRLAINRLFEHFRSKFCYDVRQLADFHHREFCTIESPTLRELAAYLQIGASAQISLSRQIGCIGQMIGHYLRGKRREEPKRLASTPLIDASNSAGDRIAA